MLYTRSYKNLVHIIVKICQGSCDNAQSAGGCDNVQSVAERSYPVRGQGAGVRRTPCLRGGGREELPPSPRSGVPEGLEELFHFEGREGR